MIPMTTAFSTAIAGAAGLFGIGAYRYFARQVPMLMYHRVQNIPGDRLSMPPAQFNEQLDYLQDRGYHTISVAQLYAHLIEGTALPPKPVILSFDDGYNDNLHNALPALKRHGMTGIVFAISDWVGAENGWEDYDNKPHCRTMTWDELRIWHQEGMEIGSHTVSHPHLNQLSDEQIAHELIESKRVLEDQLAIPIDFLAYPYGDFDERVKRQAQLAGYKVGIAIFEGASIWHNDLFALRRNIIASTNSLHAFANKVSTWHVPMIGLRQLERSIRFKR